MSISKMIRLFIALSYSTIMTVFLFLFSFLHFLFHPSRWFRARLVYPPPPCLQDPVYGEHSFVTVNRIKIHCVSSGTKDAPLLLFLHGFPEFWYSWRFQIKHFKLQYRVVAVDLRGYGESDKPSQQDQYGLDLIFSDITELVAALGYNF